ncbi:MAG: hypothetical protein KA712_21035 [Myxococcales bacterium]|nr:hypothetical protein [Myxococcales bacterium]
MADAFEDERVHLLPLPQNPFPCEKLLAVRSGKQPYVRFDLNDYSIPHTHVGQALSLSCSEKAVRVLDETGHVLARHERCYERGRTIEDPAHLAGLREQKQRGRELRGRGRLLEVIPSCKPFLEQLALRGQSMSYETVRLTRLLDQFGVEKLQVAIERAIAQGAISAASVAHILDVDNRRQGVRPPLPQPVSSDPRIANLRVDTHNLKPYDELARDTEDES